MGKQENFWGWKAPAPPEFEELPPGTFTGTAEQWKSLTPGYRREIYRDALRRKDLTISPK